MPTEVAAPESLADFPVGFHYTAASPVEQMRFCLYIGRLLALEHRAGLAATHAIDEAIGACRAQVCNVWIPEARKKLAAMIDAKKAIDAARPEEELVREFEKTTKAAERTAAKLDEAIASNDQAERAKLAAERDLAEFRDAQALLASGDEVLQFAWSELQGS